MFFGLIWFSLFLLLAFIRPNTEIVADFIEHRVYLPMIGFIVLLLEIDFIKNLDFRKKSNLTAIILLLLSLSLINFNHSKNFRDRLSFWKNAAQNSPHSPLAHRNLGAMYYLDGLPDKAEIEYRRSLELNPYERMAHNNLGLIYANKNMLKEAEAEYRMEIRINPRYDTVYFNFGLLYFKQRKFKEAESMWKKTLELNPDYIDAYSNLAVYYYQQNNRERSMYYVDQLKKRGVKIDPKLLKALTSHDR